MVLIDELTLFCKNAKPDAKEFHEKIKYSLYKRYLYSRSV